MEPEPDRRRGPSPPFGDIGKLLLDIDNDGVNEYIYDPVTQELSVYTEPKQNEGFPFAFIILLIIGIIINIFPMQLFVKEKTVFSLKFCGIKTGLFQEQILINSGL